MPDNCPVCNKPLSTHPDGLACCPCCGKCCEMTCEPGVVKSFPPYVAVACCGRLVRHDTQAWYVGKRAKNIQKQARAWVVKEWNRRAPHAETERLRARVKELESLRDRCIRVANNALWFDDSHDYGPALRDVCEAFGMDRDTIGTDYIEEPKGPAHD